jgi:hypothetical protein
MPHNSVHYGFVGSKWFNFFIAFSSGLDTCIRNSEPGARDEKKPDSKPWLYLKLMWLVRFLKLMALLWVTEDTTFLWWFVDILFFLTSLNILQVPV